MKSMTGFSEASLNKDGIQFKCFVKSLNSRFIEVNIKLPNNYGSNYSLDCKNANLFRSFTESISTLLLFQIDIFPL